MSLTIIIALITIGLSSYTTYFSHSIYNSLSSFLNIFEGKMKRNETHRRDPHYDVVLIGGHRAGSRIIKTLQELKTKFIVVDYNPRIIKDLTNKGINCIYGDANDKEFINELKLGKAKMIISTIPSIESDIKIRDKLEELSSSAIFIATTERESDAIDLYHKGIDFIILPHYLGGEYIAELIKENKFNYRKYKKAGKNLLKELKK